MSPRGWHLSVAAIFAAFALSASLQAQSLVNIETVFVGDAGNAGDTNGYGAVSYDFRIGKYEVTIGQYTAFLNSVARTNTNSYIIDLWTSNMSTNVSITRWYTAGINRSGSGTPEDPFVYTAVGPTGWAPAGAGSTGNRPIAYISWFGAARFCNWMHNGATNGASTETGAYTLNGATNGTGFTKNAGAKWWIPSEHEWYKAAYYKGGGTNAGFWLYPTRSDTPPGNIIGGATNQANCNNGVYSVTQQAPPIALGQNYLTDAGAFSGSAGPYGTFDQGGNLAEWNDAVSSSSYQAATRGGSWQAPPSTLHSSSGSYNTNAGQRINTLGFRVASITNRNVILTVEKTATLPGQWQSGLQTSAGPLTNTGVLYRSKLALAPGTITNVVLTVEKNSGQNTQWQFDREINVGPMTNTDEFYRLKVGTVVP